MSRSRDVKAFNHIYPAHIATDGQPAGSKNRLVLVTAVDDPRAKATVTDLLDQFGFDTLSGVAARPISDNLVVPIRRSPHFCSASAAERAAWWIVDILSVETSAVSH